MLKKLSFILLTALFLSGCSTKDLPKQGSPAPESAEGQNYTVKGLKAAVDLGLTLKCTYVVNNASYEGYIKGRQWRGKVQNPNAGVSEVIIKEDGCMYSWNESSKQGVKMCFDPAEMWEQEETMTDVEYKCKITIVDDSIFNPPSDVTYIEPMNMQ
ncbi:MAG: hypothetical protein PVJ09_01985 [Candidatus Woesebacteria bacterium]